MGFKWRIEAFPRIAQPTTTRTRCRPGVAGYACVASRTCFGTISGPIAPVKEKKNKKNKKEERKKAQSLYSCPCMSICTVKGLFVSRNSLSPVPSLVNPPELLGSSKTACCFTLLHTLFTSLGFFGREENGKLVENAGRGRGRESERNKVNVDVFDRRETCRLRRPISIYCIHVTLL